jgi:hypothetical protein
VIVTEKLALAVLPCASVAVQLTGVVPTGNAEPDAGAQLIAGVASTASVAVAVKLTTVVAPVASAVTETGTVSAGGVLSVTVTVNPALT